MRKLIYSSLIVVFIFSGLFFGNNKLTAQIPLETMGLEDYYDVIPDVPGCKEGTLKDSEKQKLLQAINYIRNLHGVKPVTYDNSHDLECAKAALIMVAHDTLEHYPPSSFNCYTSQGATGAGESNLFWGSYIPNQYYYTTESSINTWMVDYGVPDCGHRRWILNPFLKTVSIGRVDGQSKRNPANYRTSMALHVRNTTQNLSDWNNDFFAYPYQNYPKAFFYIYGTYNWYMSFTAVFNKTDLWSNKAVSFASATIEIKDENNNPVTVTDIAADNGSAQAGVPNLLVWKIAGLQNDKRYNVTIKNVKYNTQTKNFSYWFNITDNVAPDVPQPPVLSSPANSSKDLDLSQTLMWNASQNADYYNVQLSSDNTFKTGLKEFKNVTVLFQAVPGLNENTTYYWRVAAGNGVGLSGWSSVWNFKTKTMPIPSPVVVAPVDGASSVSTRTKFKWGNVIGATAFNLQIASQANFDTYSIIIDEKNIYDTAYSFQPGYLNNMAQYYWRVMAKGISSNSAWSTVRTFWTEDPSGVDFLASDNSREKNMDIYPNPVQNTASIKFRLSETDNYSLKVYDLYGREVYSISAGRYEPGNYQVKFVASGLAEGVYILKLYSSGLSITKQLIVIK